MKPLQGNQVRLIANRRELLTLRDILPITPGLRVPFVAKTPAPTSVEIGHYFQGRQGKMFWSKLKEYSLLKPTMDFEDNSLLNHGYGLTDIVKVPHQFRDEPSDQDYKDGAPRILDLIRTHRPKAVVFVYKKVLDNILRLHFNVATKSIYGFNQSHEGKFGARVFAFPLPGTPCDAVTAKSAMLEFAECLRA